MFQFIQRCEGDVNSDNEYSDVLFFYTRRLLSLFCAVRLTHSAPGAVLESDLVFIPEVQQQ